MTKDEAEQKILELLDQRKNKIVGRNIVSAALSLFSNPVEAVEKLFFGVESEISDEKLKLEQELILEMICQINETVSNIQNQFNSLYNGEKSIVIEGLIEVSSRDSSTTTGVHIKSNSGHVEFKPGTKISVKSENSSGDTTGLRIGD